MQTIEARAILSAADRTGGIFSQIAAKIKGMNAAALQANRTTAATGIAATAGSRQIMAANRASMMANTAMMGAASRVMAPAAIAYGAKTSFENFAEADLKIRRIGITADASAEEVKGLGKTIREISFTTGKSFSEVTKGMESLVAGGMDFKEAIPALPAIAKTAQAAGAEVEDMATTTLALNQNLKISTDSMQNAFDIMVKGGKAGKFELKDMARYFPSIAPAAVAAGMKGEEGLMRIVAALQTIRQGTGTTEEAAASMQNIFAKMESETTTKKFKEFGVDLAGEMKKARAEGKDLLETFVNLSDKALKGDLSKIPQLFSDMEFARGMRALLSFKDLNKKVLGELRTSAGSTAEDFNKIMNAPAIAMARLKGAVDNNVNAIGAALERLPKMFSQSGKGLSDYIDDASKTINEKGFVGLLPESDQKDIAAIKKVFDFATSEQKQLETMLAHRERMGQKDDASVGPRRLRLFDLQRRQKLEEDQAGIPPLQDEMEKMREKWREEMLREHVPMPTSDPRKAKGFVPMPTSDPRKEGYGSEAPPVQPLDIASAMKGANVEAKLTGEAEVKGQTEVTVKVEAGSELLRIVDNIKSAVANLAGKLTANGAGSTGRSSPDAMPSSLNNGMPQP